MKVTAIFVASPIKNHIEQFILPLGVVLFVNLLTDRKVIDSTPKCSLLDGDSNRLLLFLLSSDKKE